MSHVAQVQALYVEDRLQLCGVGGIGAHVGPKGILPCRNQQEPHEREWVMYLLHLLYVYFTYG